MINKKVENALNEQASKELYSSMLYLSMASWAETGGYKGIAEWLYVQAEEEKEHMLRFMRYINDRGGKAVVAAIDQPPGEFKSVKEMFEHVLKHEQYVSELINNIVQLCVEEKDFTTHNWIQWFVNEQIEEESSVRDILDKLKLVGDSGMYLFDRDIIALRSGSEGEAAGAEA
jgi:ferritin